MDRYAGKKAVIIGGTHGMGLAIVKALLGGGADVLLTGNNEDNVETARRELGPGAHVIRSDATKPADIEALAEHVEEKLGRADYLHVNVGFAKLEPFELVTEATYDDTFAVNAKGAFFTVQRLVPLISDGGAVLFTAAAPAGVPGLAAFAGAKAAVRAFAQVLAVELLPKRIRVNVVSPGFIGAPSLGSANGTRGQFEAFGAAFTPLGRIGTAEEVASAALFLAFDATFTTAVEVPVDGGLAQALISLDPVSHSS